MRKLKVKTLALSVRDVTLSLFTKQRTKFDFVFPKTLEMISRHLEISLNFQKTIIRENKVNVF